MPQEDKLFIMLKFEENYTDNELANYFKISEMEVKEKEIKIFSIIKNNPSIKKLKKNRKSKY